jgi:predicted DNA-binding transcriptional regulator AlpA
MKNKDKKSISASLENFDLLPDSAYVRQPVVEGLFACSGPTIWRRVKNGSIPAPKKLSAGVTGWNVGTLRAVQKALTEEASHAV